MSSPEVPERLPAFAGAEFDVVAEGYPEIRRVCPSCSRLQSFGCTGNFRINASGKIFDIWLLYRCTRCASTYNFTVLERTPVNKIDRALLQGATDNDKRLAGKYARDVALMKRNGVQLARGDMWSLISDPAAPISRWPAVMVCRLDPPLIVRADHLIASALSLSHAVTAGHFRAGSIRLLSEGNPRALRLWSRCTYEVSHDAGAYSDVDPRDHP